VFFGRCSRPKNTKPSKKIRGKMSASYCAGAAGHPLHKLYHDQEYGFPLTSDSALFERLVFEINQAGLSWTTILNKKENFRRAYNSFDIDRVAAYGETDIARLLADAGIIRNRRKIAAAVENARRLVGIRQEYVSFAAWLDAHHPRSKEAWVKLFKQTFVFTGGEIVNEFLISTGYLPGAHEPWCPVYTQIAALNPPWMRIAH
jgi:DNA-3-methyladenine glycosylase I